MKKILLVLTILCAGLVSYPQTHEKIKLIANELKNYETYQSVCEYTFSIPFGDTITTERIITTKLMPTDKLSGFYYVFETIENYKGVKFMDFTMYFDSIVYSSYLGKVKKTSYYESPSQFIEMKLKNGFVSSILMNKNTFANKYRTGENRNDSITHLLANLRLCFDLPNFFLNI